MKFPLLFAGGMAKRLLRENPGWRRSVPWELLEAHRPAVIALCGHDLEALARHGGISPIELAMVLDAGTGEDWTGRPLVEAIARIDAAVDQHEAEREARDAATWAEALEPEERREPKPDGDDKA